MNRKYFPIKQLLPICFVITAGFGMVNVKAQVAEKVASVQPVSSITGAKKTNATTVEFTNSQNQKFQLDFYGDNIFRFFEDHSGKGMRNPEAKPEAKILVDNPRKPVTKLDVAESGTEISVSTGKINIVFDKKTSLFKIIDLTTKKIVVEETAAPSFSPEETGFVLKQNSGEYFYGGGVQNGRFSHKGKLISIENQNSWTDGGVASPTPFYWSSNGYGIMWNTFASGVYDFGSKQNDAVKVSHKTDYLDVFFMVSPTPKGLLNDFYQLTGNPVLLPKFAFYEGHLNAYNRDYWKESTKGVPFEDGKKYVESQKDATGIKESLNGEKNNYQFSARAVIDRYKKHDMPLGWILPNDGYGAGYGQTETLDGNIANLKSFGDYARKNGVEIGLWTQSDLHPKEGVSALLQRDIVKEVRDAGVRVLKTDVAWVGAGYSFGLNGVADVATIMPKYGNNARPFIISLDGWAGTQRYASIWSGDQTGGLWEYIRFHIPTYIGSGLSGQPNISSDMDGIFGGKNPVMNTRDFQWKTFTPMELNMDGWGSNEKYPHALGEPSASINRNYLKLKSELLPYAYSIARESVDGLPMIRAMFLEEKNTYTEGKATQYQFMYGPSFLVAPIYQETKSDQQGNDIRNGIYLPKGTWIDYFSGDQFEGNRIINYFDSPVWKLPVFVKSGAIIPMVNPNNNVNEINKNNRIYEVYPSGTSSFTEYDDDGTTEEYKGGKGIYTWIESQEDGKGNVTLTVNPAKGNYTGMVKDKTTEFRINATQKPTAISAAIGKKKVKLSEASSLADLHSKTNVFYYNAAPELNQFSTPGSEFSKVKMTKNPQIIVKLGSSDITADQITVKLKGYRFAPADKLRTKTGVLAAPASAVVTEKNKQPYSLTPSWDKTPNADYYEIEFNNMLYSTIKEPELLFEDLTPETKYDFKVRAVNKSGVSPWATFSATTKDNPLQYAIKNIEASATTPDQPGDEISSLFNFDESDMWHTDWSTKAVPFDMIIDLKTVNQLDRLQYLPRNGGSNGNLVAGQISVSSDRTNWTPVGDFKWANDLTTKTFNFTSHPTVRFVKISVTRAVGDFGSGREMYFFKVPGTESYLPGDINHDRLVDANDFTSYINYTGLKKGDSDFEGYVSKGDINNNGLIDAYDISVVSTRMEGGAKAKPEEKVAGALKFTAPSKTYNPGETVEIKISGSQLKNVNALSMAIPYNNTQFEFAGIEPLNLKQMQNLTNDRLHTSGEKVLYPTFVNVGNQTALEGSSDLFIIKFKAKQKAAFPLKPSEGLLVDKNLNSLKF